MKKLYEALSVDVVKFEAQDVITASGGGVDEEVPADKENIGGGGDKWTPPAL